jgi:hypothetical protein
LFLWFFLSPGLRVDAFFLEMDVWLLRDPRPLFYAPYSPGPIPPDSGKGHNSNVTGSNGDEAGPIERVTGAIKAAQAMEAGTVAGGHRGARKRPDMIISVHQVASHRGK